MTREAKEQDLCVRVAVHEVTDVLLQIYDSFDRTIPEEPTLFAFKIGECISEWLLNSSHFDGRLELDENERKILLRAALHLERHARMIRDTLTGPVWCPDKDDAPHERGAPVC